MDDVHQIHRLIAHFANCFDLKDWAGLQACLTDELYTDYSDLRGTRPQTLSAAAYVQTRREALDQLQLHHLVSNYEVDFPGRPAATCRASMIVWRRSAQEQFSSHCLYDFQLARQQGSWKINGITQKVLWNEGAAAIHSGAQGG